MNRFSNKNIATAFYLSLKNKNISEQDIVFKNIIYFLNKNNLLMKSKNIISFLKNIINKENDILEVKVWTKENLNNEVKEKLVQIFKKHYGEKNIIWDQILDENMIGGFKVKINNEVIDLSLKNKIYKLQEYLNKKYE